MLLASQPAFPSLPLLFSPDFLHSAVFFILSSFFRLCFSLDASPSFALFHAKDFGISSSRFAAACRRHDAAFAMLLGGAMMFSRLFFETPADARRFARFAASPRERLFADAIFSTPMAYVERAATRLMLSFACPRRAIIVSF